MKKLPYWWQPFTNVRGFRENPRLIERAEGCFLYTPDGREILDILAERGFPAEKVFALASRRSQGTEVSFGDKTLICDDLATFDFSKTDICLMSAGGDVSREWAPRIGRAS